MLKSIRLVNYQAHQDTYIEFTDTQTVITGANNSNKTGVIRALEILLFGAPFPEYDISHGETKSILEVEFQDGRKVIRTRTKTVQTTKLGDTEYKGIRDIKDEIAAYTGFKKIALDPNSSAELLQLVHVHDSLFFHEQSAEITLRKISFLLAGSGFESAKTSLAKDLATANAEQKISLKRAEELLAKKELLPRDKLAQVQLMLVDVSEYESLAEAEEAKIAWLISCIKQLESLFSQLRTPGVLQTLKSDLEDTSLEDLESLYDKYLFVKKAVGTLDKLHVEIGLLQKEASGIHTELESIGKVLQSMVCKKCDRLVKVLE